MFIIYQGFSLHEIILLLDVRLLKELDKTNLSFFKLIAFHFECTYINVTHREKLVLY